MKISSKVSEYGLKGLMLPLKLGSRTGQGDESEFLFNREKVIARIDNVYDSQRDVANVEKDL